MLADLKGKFPVTIEFEDDSFVHTEAELLSGNKFQFKNTSKDVANRFRMLLVNDGELQQFECTVDPSQEAGADAVVVGTLSPIDL